MKKRRRAASPALGCLFWAALAAVLAAVALAVREPVTRNVRALLGRPAAAEPAGPGSHAAAEPAPTRSPAATPPPAAPAVPAPSPASPAVLNGIGPTPPTAGPPPVAPPSEAARTRTARLWFAKVDAEGAIELTPVRRTVPAGDSPLRENLAALLAGPTASERGAGVVSLIPAGTVVRSVTVHGETATIDFSEQFRFNALGIEGLRAQLRQVVWAATEFPTVSRVQILIEGKRVDYLGPEGAAVGSPLGRDSDFH